MSTLAKAMVRNISTVLLTMGVILDFIFIKGSRKLKASRGRNQLKGVPSRDRIERVVEKAGRSSFGFFRKSRDNMNLTIRPTTMATAIRIKSHTKSGK